MMATMATKKENNQNTVVWLILVLYHDGQQQLSNKQIQKLRPTISTKSNRLNFISDETRLRIKKAVTYSQGDLSLVPIQKGFPLFDGDGVPFDAALDGVIFVSRTSLHSDFSLRINSVVGISWASFWAGMSLRRARIHERRWRHRVCPYLMIKMR